MKKIVVIFILLLIGLEGIGWLMYKKSKENDSEGKSSQVENSANIPISNNLQKPQKQSQSQEQINDETVIADQKVNNDEVEISSWNGDVSTFPEPSIEMVDGVVQRTIHMGVRQWAWDPAEIQANFGEKVILIMHNADVQHSISIPQFSMREEIPEEGAVIMFTADKKGTFEFSCDTPCGVGHAKMKGKITIS